LYAAVCPAPARWVVDDEDVDVVAVVGWVVGGICCWVKVAGAWREGCVSLDGLFDVLRP